MRNFLQQLTRIWGDLGLNQRVSIVLAGLGTIVGLVLLTMWSGRPQHQMLYSNVEPAEMADIVSTLNENGIPHEVDPSGTSVSVPSEHLHTARLELASQGLPTGGSVGYELFDKGSFGMSDFMQRANYIRAVQGELARTIARIRQVKEARVMIVMPENKYLLTDRNARPTASVLVETGGLVLPPESVNSIRFLVANSVEGLQLNDVAVVDNHGNVLSEELSEDSMMGAATGAFKYQRNLEEYFTKKIETMLTPVVGLGRVVARVSVDVDQEAQKKVDEIIYPETATVVSQSSSEDSTLSTETAPGGAVGVDANLPEDDGAVARNQQVSNSEQSKKNRSQDYAMSRSTVETQKAPGAIKRVSAAIFLAQRSIEGDGGEMVPQPRTQEELNRLQQMVTNALGIDQNVGPAGDTLVTLTEIPFEGDSMMTPGSGPAAGDLFVWAEVARKGMAVAVAVGMFVIFLRLLRKQKPEAVKMEVVQEEKEQLPDLREITPSLTPELLNELIRQKPDNVSTALKNWVQVPVAKK